MRRILVMLAAALALAAAAAAPTGAAATGQVAGLQELCEGTGGDFEANGALYFCAPGPTTPAVGWRAICDHELGFYGNTTNPTEWSCKQSVI